MHFMTTLLIIKDQVLKMQETEEKAHNLPVINDVTTMPRKKI